MATQQSTADEITGLLHDLDVRTRKMFGEYALYCDDKVVGLICDNQLFIKDTTAGRDQIESPVLAPPYPKAKDYILLSPDTWLEKDTLQRLIQVTASELPRQKVKKRKI